MQALHTAARARGPRALTRPPRLISLLGLCAALTAAPALSHNNPTFREELLTTVEVTPADDPAAPASSPFSLSWPKKTVQLLWRVKDPGPGAEGIGFTVSQDGAPVAEGLKHDASSKRLSGEGFTVTGVSGADSGFVLEVYAKVLDRSQKDKKEPRP